MALALAPAPSCLTITAIPPRLALQQWWQARQADPDCCLAFGDDAPVNFAALCHRLACAEYLFYLAQTATAPVVGAMWCHDLVCAPDGTPRAGWLGTYVLPDCRGEHTTQAMWTLVQRALARQGIHQVYIASHHANRRAHRVAEEHLGFHRVGIYPGFALFGGQPTDCLILSLHQADRADAWACATRRACRQYTRPTVVQDSVPLLASPINRLMDGMMVTP
jgi:hypothetical protein